MISGEIVENYLHEQIPISKAMGIRVVEASPDNIRLFVPFGPNLNHRKTVFGGSASAAATLAAWCLLYVKLAGHEARPTLVISENQTTYTRPITTDFEAVSHRIEDEEWSHFCRVLGRKGKARIVVRSYLEADGEECCTFTGTFVALVGC